MGWDDEKVLRVLQDVLVTTNICNQLDIWSTDSDQSHSLPSNWKVKQRNLCAEASPNKRTIYICDFRAQDPEAPQSRLPSRTYSWLALLLLTQWWLKCLYRTRTAYLEHPTSAKHCVPCHESLPNATKGANLIVFIDWEDSELFHPMFLPNGGPSHSSLPTYSKTRSHAQRTALDVESLSGPVADHQFVEGWKAATFPRLCTFSEVFRREWHWSLKLVVEPSAHKEA